LVSPFLEGQFSRNFINERPNYSGHFVAVCELIILAFLKRF